MKLAFSKYNVVSDACNQLTELKQLDMWCRVGKTASRRQDSLDSLYVDWISSTFFTFGFSAVHGGASCSSSLELIDILLCIPPPTVRMSRISTSLISQSVSLLGKNQHLLPPCGLTSTTHSLRIEINIIITWFNMALCLWLMFSLRVQREKLGRQALLVLQ